MKNKLILFATVIVAFFTTLIVSIFFDDKTVVYHQHLESKVMDTCSSDSDIFCTHLPIVSINTNNQHIPGESYEGITIKTNISLYDNNDSINLITDVPSQESLANIRYRGNSSMEFDKKGFLLKFINEDNTEKKLSVLGMPSHDEWILNGPYLDKTLIRNYMMYNISHEIMGYAPNVRFCELFIDGKYQGVYLMLESPTRGEGSRIPVSKYNSRKNYTPYIVRLDRGSSDLTSVIDSFSNYTSIAASKKDIIYPGKENLTQEINDYITNDLSEFEKALYSFDYDTNRYGYDNFIDVDSFINYFIINEFFQNSDAGMLSTYLYKDPHRRYGLYVWDFNNAVDNYQETEHPYDEDYLLINRLYFSMLLRDEKFTEKLINRYKYLRTTYLNEKYIDKYMDDTIKYLGKAIDRNFKVWGYTFDANMTNLLIPNTRDLHSYEEAVNQLRTRIHERGEWMDGTIDTLRQFSHESKVKRYNH